MKGLSVFVQYILVQEITDDDLSPSKTAPSLMQEKFNCTIRGHAAFPQSATRKNNKRDASGVKRLFDV